MNMEKQDEILAVDPPTITDTEAETFPAAGIVEEAAQTTPQNLLLKEKIGGNSPCAACKFLRRRCTKDCPFAPYFPSHELQKFAIAHKVFGASNISKMLQYSEKIGLDREMTLRNCENLLLKEKIGGNSPCAACKFLRRRCTKDCPFAPYFPSHELQKFAIVHKVFGASNISKMLQAKEIDFLPLSLKDLANTPLKQKALTGEAFLSFVVRGMLDISPQQYGILLMICFGFLSYYAKNSTIPFDMLQFGKTTTTPVQSLISFSEAFYAFFPEITHITKFMLCYVLSWMLVLPLRPGMQIFLVLLLISAPIFYFPELVHKASASGIHVACGSFKLPLIGFATLGAIGLSLICGFVTLLMVYLRWRFIYKGKPRDRAIEVSLDCLSEILQG